MIPLTRGRGQPHVSLGVSETLPVVRQPGAEIYRIVWKQYTITPVCA